MIMKRPLDIDLWGAGRVIKKSTDVLMDRLLDVVLEKDQELAIELVAELQSIITPDVASDEEEEVEVIARNQPDSIDSQKFIAVFEEIISNISYVGKVTEELLDSLFDVLSSLDICPPDYLLSLAVSGKGDVGICKYLCKTKGYKADHKSSIASIVSDDLFEKLEYRSPLPCINAVLRQNIELCKFFIEDINKNDKIIPNILYESAISGMRDLCEFIIESCKINVSKFVNVRTYVGGLDNQEYSFFDEVPEDLRDIFGFKYNHCKALFLDDDV